MGRSRKDNHGSWQGSGEHNPAKRKFRGSRKTPAQRLRLADRAADRAQEAEEAWQEAWGRAEMRAEQADEAAGTAGREAKRSSVQLHNERVENMKREEQHKATLKKMEEEKSRELLKQQEKTQLQLQHRDQEWTAAVKHRDAWHFGVRKSLNDDLEESQSQRRILAGRLQDEQEAARKDRKEARAELLSEQAKNIALEVQMIGRKRGGGGGREGGSGGYAGVGGSSASGKRR
ncbi:unnamed protein product [Symbiodinium sp. CCMP2592]|nr:unnamed protein product [Symbiodinium sp. CCMP2592]